MTIAKSAVDLSAKSLVARVDKKEIRFDLAIQRNFVWDLKRQSLFIHSLMIGLPFPVAYAQDKGDKILWMLDGKQRMSTTYRFMKDQFPLDASTPNVEDAEVAGKKYSELPESLQDAIKDAKFVVIKMDGLTDELRDEMFLRHNNGMPLTKMELTRVVASSNVMEFVNEISGTKFFHDIVSITDKARTHFVDDELVLQVIALITKNGPVDFSGNKLQNFAKTLKENGVPDNIKDTIRKITEYLTVALPNPDKALRKAHVPMIFMMAKKAIESDPAIPAVKFGGWVQSFFAKIKENRHRNYIDYSRAADRGSAKLDNVSKRLRLMEEEYDKNIWEADDYKAPVVAAPSASTGKRGRGRPRKNSAPTPSPAPVAEATSTSTVTPPAENVDQVTNQDQIPA